jgi:putative cardiolipin synthase
LHTKFQNTMHSASSVATPAAEHVPGAALRARHTGRGLPWRRTAGWHWAAALACSFALFAAGCATQAPPPKPPVSMAQPPLPDSPFAAAEDRIRAAHGDQSSGFRLLRVNLDALAWRLALIDSARHSIDLQYYVWFGDKVGQLLMARVIAAADRGVKVRLLFDDLSTLLHDMESVELRDALLATVDRHPNIEIRVFNAWQQRGLLGRAVESVGEFSRLNRRMHNKQMIADNRAAIIGGRNVGDEYFGLNAGFNFHDLDVLGVGPVAREASAVFDRYWNSDWVRGIPRENAFGLAPERSAAEEAAFAALMSDPRAREELAGKHSWAAEMDSLATTLLAGRSAVHTDSPSRAETTRNHMPEAFRALLRSAQREVLITNAYIIPDDALITDLNELRARGVTVRILTNSLASHDVPAVNSHYETWRKPMLQAGVALYELRADAAVQATVVDTAPVHGRFVGLHTKAMVIDRQRSFVGSMNLDPRSEVINSEMGVVIDSAELASALAQAMQQDMGGSNSWSVTLGPDDALRWTSDAGTQSTQPARGAWQRVQNAFFKLFPPNLY